MFVVALLLCVCVCDLLVLRFGFALDVFAVWGIVCGFLLCGFG